MLIVTIIIFSLGFVFCFSCSISHFIKAAMLYKVMIDDAVYSFTGYYIISLTYFLASLVVLFFVISFIVLYKKSKVDVGRTN